MLENKKLITVYSGSETEVFLLKGLLKEIGVESVVRNDFQSGINAGFGAGTISTVRLQVAESDIEKGRSVLESFIATNS